jgi:probable phosphoglycerate mutase
MKTQITFVRHGQNKIYSVGEPKYPGPGLTKKGISQAKKTAFYLKNYKFDRIYCSDMTRAMETSQEIKKYQRCKLTYHHELAEVNMIIFDKKPYDEDKLKTNMKRIKNAFAFFKKILKENKGKKILIVAHGNAIHALIGRAMGFKLVDTPRFHMTNCAITTLVFDNGKVVGMPMVCFDGHHTKDGFKEKIEEYHEKVEYYSNPKNRFM